MGESTILNFTSQIWQLLSFIMSRSLENGDKIIISMYDERYRSQIANDDNVWNSGVTPLLVIVFKGHKYQIRGCFKFFVKSLFEKLHFKLQFWEQTKT